MRVSLIITKQGLKLLTKELLKFAWVGSLFKKSVTSFVCWFFSCAWFTWNGTYLAWFMGSTGSIRKVSLLYEAAVTTGEFRKFMCFADM